MRVIRGAEAFREIEARFRGTCDAGVMFNEPAFRRLAEALCERTGSAAPSPADLLPLIRDALRYWEAGSGVRPEMRVPVDRCPVIATKLAKRHGLEAHVVDGVASVIAVPWRPVWLPGAPANGVDRDASARTRRQHSHAKLADPFFRAALGFETYRSPGQRAAVRAIVDAPPGSTLSVVLPTGDGKSACFHTAAKVGWTDRANRKGVVLVITPTIALGLDHEQNTKALRSADGLPAFRDDPMAYQPNDAGAQGILERVRRGDQEILFASPESVLGSLLQPLREAARTGLISGLVIDEAHLVDAWGGVFRPDFQLLSGLFRELILASPDPKPRVLLLTATLTETAAVALRGLFGSADRPYGVVAAPTVRPEHDYWTSGFVGNEQQAAMVDEAVAHLPRPLIVYCTTKEDVRLNYQRLLDRGHARVGWMTGESPSEDRRQLLDGWARGRVDIVVATSAFGLGVNNSDVRAVIHACIPEGVDRFYQEVGRAGRDGAAAVSVIVPTLPNLAEGQRLAGQRLITPDKGYPRWVQMFRTATQLDGGSPDELQLEFDVAPGKDPDRIDMLNDENTKWNLRVLSMMTICGLLTIRRAPYFRNIDGRRKAFVLVGIEEVRHLDREVFDQAVDSVRRRVAVNSAESMRRLEAVVRWLMCLGVAVRDQYSVSLRPDTGADIAIAGMCPGCAHCRPDVDQTPMRLSDPVHPWIMRPMPQRLAAWLDARSRLVVTYEGALMPAARRDAERRKAALARLLAGTVRNVRLDQAAGITADDVQSVCPQWPMFFAPDPVVGGRLPVSPTLVVYADRPPIVDLDFPAGSPPLIVFAPSVDERYEGAVRRIADLEDFLLQ